MGVEGGFGIQNRPEREPGRHIERGPEGGSRGDPPLNTYVTGLRTLASPHVFDRLIGDFANAADRVRWDNRLPKAVRGMLWFGFQYHQNARSALAGMDDGYERYQAETQEDYVDDTERVVVAGVQAGDGADSRGILTGIVGVDRPQEGDPYFKGVVALGERGENGLVAVRITADGKVTLHEDYEDVPGTYREAHERIMQIYPPQPQA